VNPPGSRRSTIFGRLIASRWLLLQWARRDFNVRYRQSLLGPVWSIVQPAMLLLFYGLLFVQALGVESDRGPYLVFAWCGLTAWTFFSSALSGGSSSLLNAQSILSKVYFPREIIPLGGVLVAAVDLAISTSVLLLLIGVFGVGYHLSLMGLIPLYLILVLFVGALTVFGATLASFGRDLLHALPLLLQLAFIATPVMYPTRLVPARYAWIHQANPIALVIEQVRRVVLDGRWPEALPTALGLVGALTALLLAVAYLRSVEHRLPDVI
jgi:lipopolysaccharide transport system permease protein